MFSLFLDVVILVLLANHCPWVKGMDQDLIKLVDSFKGKSVRLVGFSVNHREDDQLDAMLSQTDILVCLLPLTEQTQGILNRQLLSKLPRGSYLINAGRGLLQVESDLLILANDGQLQGLALDVFEVEPLAENSELWNHPKISITPHVASMTLPASSAVHVYDNIMRYRKNVSLTHVFDIDRGY